MLIFGLPLLIVLCTSYRVKSSPFGFNPTEEDDGSIEAWEKPEASLELEGDWHSEASSFKPIEHQQWLPRAPQPTRKEPEQDQQQGSVVRQPGEKLPWGFQDPHQALAAMASDILPASGGSLQGPLNLPMFIRTMSPIPSSVFQPESGTRPLPEAVRKMFLPPPYTKPAPPQYGAVDALCHLDRIYVRIKKELFVKPSEAWRYLKVGTCSVNEETAEHYYFLYYLKGCGLKYEEKDGFSVYSNTLTYNPPVGSGPVVREQPFSVDISCKYYKHFNAYAIGFHPEMKAGTVFARLSKSSDITFKPLDENWNTPKFGQGFPIGKLVNFEARAPSAKAGERTYVNHCFITPTTSPDSPVKHVVVENNGCLVDGKLAGGSKFMPHADKNTVRFSIVAFAFKDSTSPTGKKSLYLHCEVVAGPETPTAGAKSCSYDQATKKWTELRGDASVCSCCDSTCPTVRASKTMVSSDAWKMTEDDALSESRIEKILDITDFIETDGSADGFEKYWGSD